MILLDYQRHNKTIIFTRVKKNPALPSSRIRMSLLSDMLFAQIILQYSLGINDISWRIENHVKSEIDQRVLFLTSDPVEFWAQTGSGMFKNYHYGFSRQWPQYVVMSVKLTFLKSRAYWPSFDVSFALLQMLGATSTGNPITSYFTDHRLFTATSNIWRFLSCFCRKKTPLFEADFQSFPIDSRGTWGLNFF